MRRAVVVEGVAERRELPLEPAFVEGEAVGIGDLEDVEGDVEARAQIGVLAEETAEELERQRTDRLVGVRHADQQRRPPSVADREQLDRPAFGRRADRLQAGEPRELRDQRPRARPQLLDGQELAKVRDPCEERGEIELAAYDSSFEE
jgi:hypothetical protein